MQSLRCLFALFVFDEAGITRIRILGLGLFCTSSELLLQNRDSIPLYRKDMAKIMEAADESVVGSPR
jgi:hypothetical protein